MLDAIRIGPGRDATAVTAAKLREVIEHLVAARQWQAGDLSIVIVADAGYDITRLAYVLADLPVDLFGRMRSDRVLRGPRALRVSRTGRAGERPPRHGPEFALADPATWWTPAHTTATVTHRYGRGRHGLGRALPPADPSPGVGRAPRRAADHRRHPDPVARRTPAQRLPGDHAPKPVWLWPSVTSATAADMDRWWQSFLRRFDLQHTFRLFKQTLSWTAPKIRTPAAADRWTWLIVAAYTQLRLARPLSVDLRRPWERPAEPGRLTPARVRRGFCHLRAKTSQPATAPKPSRPGPGRPPGSRNRHRATHHDVGKHATSNTAASTAPGSGGPGESHPWAPTERSVTVSRHSALLILPS
jgi:hypothetical protein